MYARNAGITKIGKEMISMKVVVEEDKSMRALIELLEKQIKIQASPKLKVGIEETRITNKGDITDKYGKTETKTYTLQLFLPIANHDIEKITPDVLHNFMEMVRKEIEEQQQKDGIKPLRAKQPAEKKVSSPSSSSSDSRPSSIIQKAFEKAESGKDGK